jgi:hypothetical protein
VWPGRGRHGRCHRGGSNFDPAIAGIEGDVYHDAKAKLVDVEAQAALLIADKDHDEVQTEIGILAVEAQEETVNPKR